MSMVTLVSGGLDSTVMAMLTQDEGLRQFPLFIDYGQLNLEQERGACLANFQRYGLPTPECASIGGYGRLLSSGLTDTGKRVFEDAFLPGRNLMFLTMGAGYAVQRGAGAVAIGLLDDAFSLFPDQTRHFLADAEALLSKAMDQRVRVLGPLVALS